MRAFATLATLAVACAGANSPPQQPSPAYPHSTSADTPAATSPDTPLVTCPECPAPPSPYSDTEGWHCIDDPPSKDHISEFSYCWSKRDDCLEAYKLIREKRSTIKPCRPQAPAYCYDKFSSLLQHRRFRCAATMDHCERKRTIESEEELPEDGYVFSPCTEQP